MDPTTIIPNIRNLHWDNLGDLMGTWEGKTDIVLSMNLSELGRGLEQEFKDWLIERARLDGMTE